MSILPQKNSRYVAILSLADDTISRFWLMALIISVFIFGYYYFTEAWSALLPTGLR